MDILEYHKWMHRGLNLSKNRYTNEFLSKVEHFITFACYKKMFIREGVIWCPCLKLKNRKYLNPNEFKIHLYMKGFQRGYCCWSFYGEQLPRYYGKDNILNCTNEENLKEVN